MRTMQLHRGNSSVMDVTFGHEIPLKGFSYCVKKKNVNAYFHRTHLAEREGQKKYLKNVRRNVRSNLRYGCDAKRQFFCRDYTLSKNCESYSLMQKV